MPDEMRYGSIQIPYTKRQRLRIWWEAITSAILTSPPTHYTHWKEIRKGEPGYDQAPWVCVIDPNPLRFTIENGQYVPVNPETMPKEPNPNWHDAKS